MPPRETGEGFALAASDVEGLPRRTARATKGIRTQVQRTKHSTQEALAAIEAISGIIGTIGGIAGNIARRVGEQSLAATASPAISGRWPRAQVKSAAARGTMAVSANLGRAQCRGRRKALDETSESAAGTRSSADALSGLASRQKHLVEQFVV